MINVLLRCKKRFVFIIFCFLCKFDAVVSAALRMLLVFDGGVTGFTVMGHVSDLGRGIKPGFHKQSKNKHRKE